MLSARPLQMNRAASSIREIPSGASSWSSWTAWAGTRGTFSTSCTNLKRRGQVSGCWSLPSIPAGRWAAWVLTILSMVAEMELGFIKERQRAGIDAAKAEGIYKGRPATFDRGRIVSLRKEGMGAAEIANAVGCKRGNVYKTLKAAGLN